MQGQAEKLYTDQTGKMQAVFPDKRNNWYKKVTQRRRTGAEMKRGGGKKRIVRVIVIIVIVLVLLTAGGAWFAFREELAITGSIRKESEEHPVYYMEVNGDYHFQEFLEAGGASSDDEVAAFLTQYISKGFYPVEIEESGPGCSVISTMDEKGKHVWGRNFDWTETVTVLVKCVPDDGYASISTCDLRNITDSTEIRPDNLMNKMLTIAALYVPMDGINEAGLCVADLEVNEGGMTDMDTGKPDLTMTTATRLLLNRAATVDEAIALLENYDIHASGGISHHLAVSDAAGKSVVLEFMDGKMVPVNAGCATNFNLAKGDSSAGGESSQKRYEELCSAYEANAGVMTRQQVMEVLRRTAQEGEWKTRWSMAYDQDTQSISYWFDGDFEKEYRYAISE